LHEKFRWGNLFLFKIVKIFTGAKSFLLSTLFRDLHDDLLSSRTERRDLFGGIEFYWLIAAVPGRSYAALRKTAVFLASVQWGTLFILPGS